MLRQEILWFKNHQLVQLEILLKLLKELFNADNEIKIIGTRHGEKRYETLLTKEEYVVAEDLGGFFRVPADQRDLNYDKYFAEGDQKLTTVEEYNSDNTQILTIEQIKEKLLELDYVQKTIKMQKHRTNRRNGINIKRFTVMN